MISAVCGRRGVKEMLGKGNQGIRIQARKNTLDSAPVPMPTPERVIIPMAVTGGSPSVPVVKVNDVVAVGQLIANPGEGLGVPVYAGVSGKVAPMETVRLPDGTVSDAVVILSDGAQTVAEGLTPPAVTNGREFIEAVKQSGLTGLGGEGFPSWAKLAVNGIETIILNGMESEPYATADHRAIVDYAKDVIGGAQLASKFLNARRIIAAVPETDKTAIEALKAADFMDVEIRPLPERYPLGADRLLVNTVLGKPIPRGREAVDVGVVVLNVSTAAFLAQYLRTGMPLVSRVVTVDGPLVKKPGNFIVPLGTPMGKLFEAAGGLHREPTKVVCGGPIGGVSVPDLDYPLLPRYAAVIALDEKEGSVPVPGACIRCGRCISSCPMGLMPTNIYKAREEGDAQALDQLKADLCLGCGICAYVCPAKRDLITSNRLAKQMLKAYQSEKQEANRA